MGLIKFFMIGVNVIFWAFGGALLGVGIWLAVDPNAFDSMEASGMNDAMWAAVVYTMIGVGAGVFLLGFLGCCGAWKGGEGKKNIMLKLYIALVSVIIIAEIVVIVLTAIFWSSIDDGVRTQMQKDVQTKYLGTTDDDNKDGLTQSWNKMQFKWKCCGSYNFTDYKNSDYANNPDPGASNVPYTCCVFKPDSDYNNPGDVESIPLCQAEANTYSYNPSHNYEYLNARGCYKQLENFFDQNAAIIIGVSCGVLALQILGIIFACCIMNDD